MFGETTNSERASWARAAVNTFTLETYGNRLLEELHPEDQETAVQDLMTDLMHLLDRLPSESEENGADRLRNLFGSAEMHYDAEVAEDPAE